MPQHQPELNLAEFIAELGAKLNLTSEEIADVLWLSLKRQEFTENRENSKLTSDNLIGKKQPKDKTLEDKKEREEKDSKDTNTNINLSIANTTAKAPVYISQSLTQTQGLSIRIPDAPSLREPLHFAQSLQALMRRVATGNKTILDEEATVERIGSENISLPIKISVPILKSELESWLDLALVIDESQSMLIWRHTINDLQRLLKNYGIFRDLRIWCIKPNQEGNALQFFSRMGTNHRPGNPQEIIDPTGRRLILVVSDCVSNIWRKGMMFPVLQNWTQKQPLAIIQMLPEWMWRRTALSLGTAVGFTSSMAGIANRDLLVNKQFLREERTKIPVLTLKPESAKQWSQMVVGKADAAVPGYLLPTELNIEAHPLLKRQQEALAFLDSSQRVERFRSNTSPLGRKLAGLLAAAPVISLPVVRLIQESLLPESRQVQVAEVFLGGLLKPKPEQIIEPDTNPDAVEYEFSPLEIRDIFLEDAPVRDSGDVLNAVSRYVAEQMDKSLDEFMALLKTPGAAGEAKVKPFAEVTARILRKLGGDYVTIAQQLEQTSAEIELVTAIEVSLKSFDYYVAVFTSDISPREELQPFEFETVTVNRRGKVINTEQKEGFCFIEVLSGVETSPTSNYEQIEQISQIEQELSNLPPEPRESTVLRIEMVAIPSGTFIMGTEDKEIERLVKKFQMESCRYEKPQHEVRVPSFFMGKYPVTQAQWKAVAALPKVNRDLKLKPSKFKGDNLPVEQVSWYDAVEFCDRLSQHTGKQYRLPSEAEWEYACRAGTTTPFHFGETITSELANYNASNIYDGEPKGKYLQNTTSVGQFPPNAFGLYDMHGNVWEWCLDNWHDNYEGAPEDGSAWFDSEDDNLSQKQGRVVLRGGSWVDLPEYCRSASRNDNAWAEHAVIDSYLGFRVVSVFGSTLHPKGSSVCWDGNRPQQQNSL
ncbi:MAG: SUMF1/EgtB/PvdO family nonheme iron enzyme [Richelia sp. RM1_1_1]|nr:SUMF1/EgtB/PvdO family nonheme iron enzyme [Richelia sp. RM1_1_1]